ncbi:Hpt domain-containing protein [Oligoflexia bacterium]|nr:Hpt domain-containing protein [Oligoflexia bacterium]
MTEERNGHSFSKKVMQVFIDELEKDLRFAENAFGSKAAPAAADVKEGAIRFHKTKGAAAFLGFDPIAQLAASLENIFLMGDFDFSKEQEEILTSIIKLKAMANDIRKDY